MMAKENFNQNLTGQNFFIMNIMHLIDKNGYRFDFLLASIAFLTWVKTIFQFRVTQAFGPMFKIIYQMVLDLVNFLVIWQMVIFAFSCVSMLTFGECEKLRTFE